MQVLDPLAIATAASGLKEEEVVTCGSNTSSLPQPQGSTSLPTLEEVCNCHIHFSWYLNLRLESSCPFFRQSVTTNEIYKIVWVILIVLGIMRIQTRYVHCFPMTGWRWYCWGWAVHHHEWAADRHHSCGGQRAGTHPLHWSCGAGEWLSLFKENSSFQKLPKSLICLIDFITGFKICNQVVSLQVYLFPWCSPSSSSWKQEQAWMLAMV